MIDKRLPDSFNIDEPVILNDLVEYDGLLGNRTTHEIFNHDCYEFSLDTLSWLR